jgi:hypothetical protein
MTVVSENAKAIRKTLADNLENGFALITHIVDWSTRGYDT